MIAASIAADHEVNGSLKTVSAITCSKSADR
jgi:hypothetical protein